MIRWLLRTVLPKSTRVRLRSSPMMRKLAARYFGGVRSRRFLNSSYTFYFDGYRNFGMSAGNLDDLESQERDWVKKYFVQHQPKVIWDIGANVGFWSLYLSSLTQVGAQIRCFEPDPINLRYLEMNKERNGLDWTVRPVGLSDHVGRASFFSDPVTGCTGSVEPGSDFSESQFQTKSVEINIELTSIDAEIAAGATPPDFIKMDVESHELGVLRGGINMLKQYRPTMIFEATANAKEIAELFRDCNYDLHDLDGRKLDQPTYYTIATPR